MSEAIQEDTHDHAVGQVPDATPVADAKPAYDDLDTPMIALVGVVSALLTFICIFGLQAAYLQYSVELENSKVMNVRLENVERVQNAQTSKLNADYAWIDKGTEKVQMPIDRAMKVVEEHYHNIQAEK